MSTSGATPPCVIFEDEHLLVVNKPPGVNTHAPGPYAGEGIYDWLKNREPRWAQLAIIHRLDKETSGLLVFSKTSVANRSLTEQFTKRTIRKKYLLLTDRPVKKRAVQIKSCLVRAGEKYVSRPIHAGGNVAETNFRLRLADGSYHELEAEPLTGRTHQIRVHAAELGFPILGDALYGGSPGRRLCLHAAEISFRHPATGEAMHFEAPPDFGADPCIALRSAIVEPELTNAYRLIHGASDGFPGSYVDRLGDFVLFQSETAPSRPHLETLQKIATERCVRGVYHKRLIHQPGKPVSAESGPQHLLRETAPERFTILENGVRFELSFNEGYSAGLFLDQRDNRRRLLTGHVAADFPLFSSQKRTQAPEVLNTFTYTCGFSTCAAKAGAHTTSLDLSKKYLEWGRRNFGLNNLNPAEHDFIYGDVFEWLKRLAKKQRFFDVVLLDPPTFSQSKEFGAFRAQKDFRALAQAALPLLKSGGVLFASSNAATWEAAAFVPAIEKAITSSKRRILQRHYVPQPLDFPISRSDPAYLKTLWLRIG